MVFSIANFGCWSIVPKGSDDRIIAVHLLVVVVVKRIGAANLGLLFPQAAFKVGLFLPQFAEGRAVGLVLAFDVVLLMAAWHRPQRLCEEEDGGAMLLVAVAICFIGGLPHTRHG